VKPDRQRFPDFDEYLAHVDAPETELFFENIVHEDRSILDFIDAYTFLTTTQSSIRSGREGPEFRKGCSASDTQRGGV